MRSVWVKINALGVKLTSYYGIGVKKDSYQMIAGLFAI